MARLFESFLFWTCFVFDFHLFHRFLFLFTGSLPDALHVVIDRNLITGQNDESVVTAVQNLILFCSQR